MTEDPPPGADPRRWKALAVTLVAGFMGLLDVSIVNVAFPSIQHALNASLSDVQWVISGYALAFGLALVAGGRLGDALGRRRMFLIALTAFILTSALAGAATSAFWLVAARLLQGLAAGLLTPQNSGLIQDLFRGAERGRAFGMFGATVGLSTAVGPVVGGLILAAFGPEHGWRWVFYVNVPIGVLALILAARLLPRWQRKPGTRADIDFVGAILLGLAVVCLLFPLVQSENGGLTKFWWLFGRSAFWSGSGSFAGRCVRFVANAPHCWTFGFSPRHPDIRPGPRSVRCISPASPASGSYWRCFSRTASDTRRCSPASR
ncbi:MFS transporter [Fodinicola feengrottensis]|uniref:MFS transporter n=1 Tax=Fodinicola feengrottensis TaxID=435914 RepID=UPI002441CD00|nr:MFS transporter [Fodinicola feengrottensis]